MTGDLINMWEGNGQTQKVSSLEFLQIIRKNLDKIYA